jgi:D-galactose 1-dehydrogenase
MIRIALVGIGKIALDQHVPALRSSNDFELVAGVSRHHQLASAVNFTSLAELLDTGMKLDAVSICTPPQARFEIARDALRAGLHTMLEKPPAATLNEASVLRTIAGERGLALFGSWHSREAAGVAPALEWLANRRLTAAKITWKEDVRVWHPGQTWIWEAGGFGVFDPGINALSIVTRLMPNQLRLTDAELAFPANCQTPIAAELLFEGDGGVQVAMELDFLHSGPPIWDIEIETDAGVLKLEKGGAVLTIDGGKPQVLPNKEYPRLYEHFKKIITERRVCVDVEPLRLVADAFLCGRRTIVEPFVE